MDSHASETPSPSPDSPPPDLGALADVFGPSRENIAAGYVLAVGAVLVALLCLGGAIVGVTPGRGRDYGFWGDVGIRALLAVFAVAFLIAAGLFREMTRDIRGVRIYWHARGFRYADQERDRVVLWSDISSVTELIDNGHAGLFKGATAPLLMMVTNFSLLVVARDGEKFSFNGNRVKKLEKLAKYLARVADKFSIPWVVKEVGGDVGF
jgi:hypothetical protein